jgi:SHS2 domain-containing protein
MHARHEEIDHTADIGLRVYASAMADLFVEAARGMFHLVLDDFAPARMAESMSMHVQAGNAELLLRAWLAELLYIHATRRVMLSGFRIDSLDDTRITATMIATPMTAEMIDRATELKAVTYHGLALARTGDEWQAQIIFDT